MRSSLDVAIDLRAARQRVSDLQAEFVAAQRAEREERVEAKRARRRASLERSDRIVNLSAQGQSLTEIGTTMGMSEAAVHGVLWRASRAAKAGERRILVPNIDLAGMLDASLRTALRHRAPTMPAGGAR